MKRPLVATCIALSLLLILAIYFRMAGVRTKTILNSGAGTNANIVSRALPSKPGAEAKQAFPSVARPADPGEKSPSTRAPDEPARMKRMSANLLKPELKLDKENAARLRAEWNARFHAASEPLLRMEILTETPQLDDPITIKLLLDLLKNESESAVRQQIVLILGFMRTAPLEIKSVAAAFLADFHQAAESEERTRILEVISNLPTDESVAAIKTIFSSVSNPDDRLAAAQAVFKLAPRIAVDQQLRREVTDWLRSEVKSAATENRRFRAAQALAAPGQRNQVFLGEMAGIEKDPKLRKFLSLASQQFPTQ